VADIVEARSMIESGNAMVSGLLDNRLAKTCGKVGRKSTF
jgi:hypothetical protein